MNKFLSGSITAETLVGYIEGSLDVPLQHEVQQWLESNSGNRKFFNMLKEAWANSQELTGLNEDIRSSDWQLVAAAIDKSDTKARRSNSFLFNLKQWRRAAAILLLLVSLSGVYYLGMESGTPLTHTGGGYHSIIVPVGEKSELLLSDGTRVWINAGSNIRFPSQFSDELREIWLDGEAYFEVESDQKRPFMVHTSELDVKVYGTKFNLKAYADEDVIETTLVEGLVSLEPHNLINNKKQEVFLKPNHKAIYIKKKAHIDPDNELAREIKEPLSPKKIILTKTIQVEPTISWHKGKLIFVDESFESIVVKLERWYDVKIIISNDQIKKIRYTGVLKNISVEQALKAVQLTADFEYDIHENTIVISNKESPAN